MFFVRQDLAKLFAKTGGGGVSFDDITYCFIHQHEQFKLALTCIDRGI